MADADNDLVLQSQNGSVAAFETLIRNHQSMIHALTFRMTGSSADAEDLAQETFIRAYEQINRFNGGARFSTWLYSIAVHTCLNWRRNEARRVQAHSNCAEEIFARQTGATISPAQNEMARQAQAALMKLPTRQEIIYRFNSGEVRRQLASANFSQLLLPKVKTSQMKRDMRGDVTAWRWELELTQRRKEMNLPLMFTFEATAKATP